MKSQSRGANGMWAAVATAPLHVKAAVYFIAAAIQVIVASNSAYEWWLPLLLFMIAAIFVFLLGETSAPRLGAYIVAAGLSVPLLISIVYQILEDLSRGYTSNDYSLQNPLAIFHLALAFALFAFAYQGGEWFARTGLRTRIGHVTLRALQVVAVPLFLLSLVYFALILIMGIEERDLVTASRENLGLVLAHVTFAATLLVVAVSMFVFGTRHLNAPRRSTTN